MLCHLYMFFGKVNREKAFTQTGFSNLKDALEKFDIHEKSQRQIDSSIDLINFSTKVCISQQLSQQTRKIESERKEKS